MGLCPLFPSGKRRVRRYDTYCVLSNSQSHGAELSKYGQTFVDLSEYGCLRY
jgi:hypothetical protein